MFDKLLAAQKEIGAIKKDKENPYYKSSYFDINSLLDAVKPVLNKHDLILIQSLSTTPLGGPALKTEIIDSKSGERISDVCPLPDVPDAQKMGSAITYFRRYALQSLLALEAEDDDGNQAVTQKKEKPMPKDYPAPGKDNNPDPDDIPF